MADLLIVEDDPDIAELAAMLLESAGHAYGIAHNGREGLKLITARPPELVLLDVDMPIMSGPEMVCLLFMRNGGDDKIPIVLVLKEAARPLFLGRFGARPCPKWYKRGPPLLLEDQTGIQ